MIYTTISEVRNVRIGNAKAFPPTENIPEPFFTLDIVIQTEQGETKLVAFSNLHPVQIEFSDVHTPRLVNAA